MKYQIKIFLLIVSFFSVFFTYQFVGVGVTKAETLNVGISKQLGAAADEVGLSRKDPREVAVLLIRVALGLLGTLFFAQTIYAGFLWMTSEGDTKKLDTAQKYLKNGVIGLVIILTSFGIVMLISIYVIRGTGDAPGATPSQLGPGMPVIR